MEIMEAEGREIIDFVVSGLVSERPESSEVVSEIVEATSREDIFGFAVSLASILTSAFKFGVLSIPLAGSLDKSQKQ